MAIRQIFNKTMKALRNKLTGETDMQELLNRDQVKMLKTKEYVADDFDNKMAWSYRFTFDNQARKRRFLSSVEAYPEQEWDEHVTWFDDVSNLNEEICVEARCLVPEDLVSKVRYKFEHYITRELVIKP
jgi:hypothetical protein